MAGIENTVRCELVLLDAPEGDILELGDLANHGNNGLTVVGSHKPSPFSDETHLDYALTHKYVKKYIYLTSNEPIQIFDFYIERTQLSESLHQMTPQTFTAWNSTPENLENHIHRCRKVIASTNLALREEGVGAISSHFIDYYATQPLGLINMVDYFYLEEYSGSDVTPFMRPYVRPAIQTLNEAAAEFFRNNPEHNSYTSFAAGVKWFAQFGGVFPNTQCY